MFCGRSNILITEDKRMNTKAIKLGIQNRVFTINSFISKCVSENPNLLDYKALSVKKTTFGETNINDPFFDSLRSSYNKFDNWFSSKCDEECYVCRDDKNSILGFLYLKIENEYENYYDIYPRFTPKKRLKVGTFKVESTGFRLGERFVKIILDNALNYNVDEIYITLFNNKPELKALSELLTRWGFIEYGVKKTINGDECVLLKQMNVITFNNTKKDFPNIKYNVNKFILPIFSQFHTKLLPDSIVANENENNFIGNDPYKYALQKVYITWGNIKNAKSGDLILFYRMGPEGTSKRYTSIITSLAVVDEIICNFKNKEEFFTHCQNRSIFSIAQLNDFWNRHRYNLKIIKFIYVKNLYKNVTLNMLYSAGIVNSPNGPRPFHLLNDFQYDNIISQAKTNIKYIDRG